MEATLDLTTVPESQRLAVAGSLFALAAVDGEVNQRELGEIFDSTSMEGLSHATKNAIAGFIVDPPDLDEQVIRLVDAKPDLRFGGMLQLCAVALCDGVLSPSETKALERTAETLLIKPEQLKALMGFASDYLNVRARGVDDRQTADTLKKAMAGLSAVGIPLRSLYAAGAAATLRGAGLIGGMAAIGLGVFLPVIGWIIAAGAGIGSAIAKMRSKNKETGKPLQREHQLQLVIKNMQYALDQMAQEIEQLHKQNAVRDTKLRVYERKYQELQELVRQRRSAVVPS